MSFGGDLEMTPGAERGERFVGLIVFALSSCSGCFSSSTVDFSSADRANIRAPSGGVYNAEYLEAWRTIFLLRNHHPSYLSVPQAGVEQLAGVEPVVQHSLQLQEEPLSLRQMKWETHSTTTQGPQVR
jgi:hypothetical protein